MRSLALLALAALSAAFFALPAACGGDAFTAGVSDGGTDSAAGPGSDAATDTGADAGTETGSDAGTDGGSDAGPDARIGDIIYVSTTGHDIDTGLDPARPKQTIASALGEAKLFKRLMTVEVCAGTYAESQLTVGDDVILLGGFDCQSWQRTATYGWPTFDGTNLTTLINPNPSASQATLLVNGGVTSATKIDGFVIAGHTSGTAPSIGLHVGQGASPVVSDDAITGGAGQGGTTGIGSRGVLVDGTAAPEITRCAINGGSGSGSTGSVGVYLNTTGAVDLHEALVSGGTGTLATANGDLASIGVVVHASLTQSNPLTLLIVSGTDKAGTTGDTAGIFVDGTGVSAWIEGCIVSGGDSTTAGNASYGIDVTAPGGTVGIVDDRIYGGARPSNPSKTYGVYVQSAQQLSVANAMIHAGSVADSDGSWAYGVQVSAVASPAIADATIYTGSARGRCIQLDDGVTGAQIADDLLLGSDLSTTDLSETIGVAATTCSGFVQTLGNTAFGNLGLVYQCSGGAGNGGQDAVDIATLGTTLGMSGATVGNDVLIQGSCNPPGDPSCAAVSGCPATGEGCLSALFGSSWSASDDGVTSLFQPLLGDAGPSVYGWGLVPGSPCTLARGGVPIMNVTTDIDNDPRDPMHPTIGAVEYVSSVACQ